LIFLFLDFAIHHVYVLPYFWIFEFLESLLFVFAILASLLFAILNFWFFSVPFIYVGGGGISQTPINLRFGGRG